MQVRVTNYLNLRTEVPEILPSNNPGFFVPNDTITIVDTVKGQEYKGNDVWYKIEGGGFVWSGAVEKQILTDALDWWHTAYHIVDVWNELGTWGHGVKIAVIDSGIDLTHPFLDRKLIFGKNADGSADFSDELGHGTSVTGFIGGDRIHNFGTAPNCEVQMIKACKTGLMSSTQLLAGLAAVSPEIKIVNISHALDPDDAVAASLKTFFDTHQDTIFICAAGNNGIRRINDNLPASLSSVCKNVVSIGSVNKNGLPSQFFSCKSNHLSFLAPGEDLLHLNKEDPSKMYVGSGTSFAAPITAGLLALGASYLKKKSKAISMVELLELLKRSLRIVPNGDITLYGKGIIDPVSFSKLVREI